MSSKPRGPSGNRDLVAYLRETNPAMTLQAVSYTHLTLPTIYSV